MADNTCKKRHGKKDPAIAARTTAKNRAARIAREQRRQARKAEHLYAWAQRNGVKSPCGNGRDIRRAVRNERAGRAVRAAA